MFPIRDALIFILFIGSLPLCFFRPFYGILLWTIAAFLNPHRFGWGPATEFRLALAVAIPTLLGSVVFSRGWRRLFCREVLLLALLWIWFTITTLSSSNAPLFAHHAQATWERWLFVSKILLMTTVSIAVVDTGSRLRLLLLAIGGSFGLLVVKAIPWMIVTQGAFRLSGPSGTMLADNNDFALGLNMVFPMFFALANTERNRHLRWLFRFLCLAAIPAILSTHSRGGLVGLTAVLFIGSFLTRQKGLLLPSLVVAVVWMSFLMPANWKQRMDPGSFDFNDGSVQGRFNSWAFSFKLVQDNPFLGGGFDTYTPELYDRYAPDPNIVRGYHSIYFGVLAEHGFPGLLLYLTLLVSAFYALGRVVKIATVLEDERTASYAGALRLSLLAFVVSGAFLGRQYFDLFFTIIAGTAILRLLQQPEGGPTLSRFDEKASLEQDSSEPYVECQPAGHNRAGERNSAPLLP